MTWLYGSEIYNKLCKEFAGSFVAIWKGKNGRRLVCSGKIIGVEFKTTYAEMNASQMDAHVPSVAMDGCQLTFDRVVDVFTNTRVYTICRDEHNVVMGVLSSTEVAAYLLTGTITEL